ncbi:MAG: hypothetical protein Q9179_004633 [Wetmoreana sp. 5 TL-2023]
MSDNKMDNLEAGQNFFKEAIDSTADSIGEASATSKKALFTAAGAGSSKEVAELPRLGVKLSIRDQSNLWTPLHYAAANGSKYTINILLNHKSTGLFTDSDTTPLHLAAKYGHTVAVRQILKRRSHNWNTERAADQQAVERIKTAM